MEDREFKRYVNDLKRVVDGLNKDERDYLFECLGVAEDISKDIEINTVQTFIELAEQDKTIIDKYGNSIDAYFRLPNKSRKVVCGLAYRYFIDTGVMDLNLICTLINTELSHLENKEDPVITAIRENNKLYDKRPKINFDGVRYE